MLQRVFVKRWRGNMTALIDTNLLLALVFPDDVHHPVGGPEVDADSRLPLAVDERHQVPQPVGLAISIGHAGAPVEKVIHQHHALSIELWPRPLEPLRIHHTHPRPSPNRGRIHEPNVPRSSKLFKMMPLLCPKNSMIMKELSAFICSRVNFQLIKAK